MTCNYITPERIILREFLSVIDYAKLSQSHPKVIPRDCFCVSNFMKGVKTGSMRYCVKCSFSPDGGVPTPRYDSKHW